jgi:hypothetical protein
MGRGARNQKRTDKADVKAQGRANKFGDVEDRFQRLDVEDEPDSSNEEDSSDNEREDEVHFGYLLI